MSCPNLIIFCVFVDFLVFNECERALGSWPGCTCEHRFIRDEFNEDDIVCKLQKLDRLVTGSAVVHIHGEEQWKKNVALRGSSADCLGVGYVLTQIHMLLPVRQEVCEPSTGGVKHIQLGQLVL